MLKAVAILKSFTPDALEVGTTDVARKVGMPKSTAHRLLVTLTKTGLLDRKKETGKYTIGPELYKMGSLYLSATDILKAADPVTRTLNNLTSEAVSLGIRDDSNVILVLKEESKHAFRISRHVGKAVPAYASSMGKALLSELTETEIDSLYPEERLQTLTPKTIATKTKLKLELEEIRKTGVSLDKEGGYEGIEGIASVIRDASGMAVAALAIPVPIFRINKAKRERLVTLVRMGAGLVSHYLGYHDMDNPVRNIEEIISWWEQNKLDVAS